jgi:hypothetical protein
VSARPNSRSRPGCGAVTDALEPFNINAVSAVLPDLFDWRLRERNRPAQPSSGSPPPPARSYVTGEVDLAAVQGGGVGERARAEPADVVHRNHL